jgi:hypothetical protein
LESNLFFVQMLFRVPQLEQLLCLQYNNKEINSTSYLKKTLFTQIIGLEHNEKEKPAAHPEHISVSGRIGRERERRNSSLQKQSWFMLASRGSNVQAKHPTKSLLSCSCAKSLRGSAFHATWATVLSMKKKSVVNKQAGGSCLRQED